MRETAIIVGLGYTYQENKKAIEELFEVTALADNLNDGEEIDGHPCLSIEKAATRQADKFILCTKAHNAMLREQLLAAGCQENRIITWEVVEQLAYAVDKEKYERDRSTYIQQFARGGKGNFAFSHKNEYALLTDYRSEAGKIDGHYFYMDILAAKKVIEHHPPRHFDIGSRVDGFISHLLSADIEVTMIDIRPLDIPQAGCGVAGFYFQQGDATNLEEIETGSLSSISSLHAVEHFGLGRYGDSISPNACFFAMKEMQRVLAAKGYLYLALPVGKEEHLCFNAHRIFSPQTILDCMDELQLEQFYLLHGMKLYEYQRAEMENCEYKDRIGSYDCGIFIFKKE